MNQTTYYELKQYEGSDEFNPLAVDVPNMATIDDVMHANELMGVATATEVVTGTVHAIVRSKPDNAMFRFNATGDWVFGDTMTVDGIAYTVKDTAGQQLSSNAYKTGANVVGILEGSDLTLQVASVGTAPDSDRLGGELPSYYATQSDMTQAQSDIGTNANAINDLGGELHNVISNTLAAGATTVTLIDARIKTTSILEPWQYIAPDGTAQELIYPTHISLSSGQCTLTYEAQTNPVTVGVRVF